MRIALLSFLFIVAVSFMGISSNSWACPDNFRVVDSACLSPGGPDPKDGVATVPEFQLNCMDITKLAGHAEPVIGEKGSCGKGAERIWECCDLSLQ